MGGFLFRYGTAVHLALLTVAPLFLCAFCGPSAQVSVLLWLSVFASMWIVMNPSPREDEWPRDARHRIGWELARDPFLVFCVVAVVISAVRAANGGIAYDYSAASGIWRLKGPSVSLLPGSVSGQGQLPLVGLFGLAAATLGVRHALDPYARYSYLFTSGILAALVVLCWWILPFLGIPVRSLDVLLENPFHAGSLLGVFFLMAVTAWVESWSFDHLLFELLSAVAAAVLLAGMVFYAPTISLWTFASLGVAVVVLGVLLSFARRPLAAWFRTGVSLVIIIAPVVLTVTGELTRPAIWPLFPDGFLSLREVTSSIAIEAWKDATRMGVGLGAYPLAMGFYATPEDWQVLSLAQTAAPNGWIHILFERGLLGVVLMAAGLVILLRDGLLRFLRAGSGWSLTAVHLLGPLVLVGVVTVTFFECSYVQLEALMPVGAALALTAAAFPESSEIGHG